MSRRALFFIFLGIFALALWGDEKYFPKTPPKPGKELADYVANQAIQKRLKYYISIYEKIVAQDPTNKEAKDYLGKLYQEQKLLFGER